MTDVEATTTPVLPLQLFDSEGVCVVVMNDPERDTTVIGSQVLKTDDSYADLYRVMSAAVLKQSDVNMKTDGASNATFDTSCSDSTKPDVLVRSKTDFKWRDVQTLETMPNIHTLEEFNGTVIALLVSLTRMIKKFTVPLSSTPFLIRNSFTEVPLVYVRRRLYVASPFVFTTNPKIGSATVLKMVITTLHKRLMTMDSLPDECRKRFEEMVEIVQRVGTTDIDVVNYLLPI
jgi:hypothetical protein